MLGTEGTAGAAGSFTPLCLQAGSFTAGFTEVEPGHSSGLFKLLLSLITHDDLARTVWVLKVNFIINLCLRSAFASLGDLRIGALPRRPWFDAIRERD